MAERTRPIRIEICVTEQERQLIRRKMEQLGTKNMGAYARKMLIDGYIIQVDYTEQKNWLLLSVGLLPISIRYAAVSIRPAISTMMMWPS